MIKKIFILIILSVTLIGCTKEEKSLNEIKEVKVKKETNDYIEPYIDDNPIIIGLYQNNGNGIPLGNFCRNNFNNKN